MFLVLLLVSCIILVLKSVSDFRIFHHFTSGDIDAMYHSGLEILHHIPGYFIMFLVLLLLQCIISV